MKQLTESEKYYKHKNLQRIKWERRKEWWSEFWFHVIVIPPACVCILITLYLLIIGLCSFIVDTGLKTNIKIKSMERAIAELQKMPVTYYQTNVVYNVSTEGIAYYTNSLPQFKMFYIQK